jgi:hypothetical protein
MPPGCGRVTQTNCRLPATQAARKCSRKGPCEIRHGKQSRFQLGATSCAGQGQWD